jgi:uncharacterized protein (TIGR03437 family)
VRRSILALFSCLSVVPPLTAASVGSGAPQPVQQSFQNAFSRGQFSQLVLPPTGNVKNLGSTGLVQEFTSKANAALIFALIDPNPNGDNSTWQVYSDIYSFYSSPAILNAAGYPAGDTAACPPNGFGKCDYQFFTNNYVIFAYSTPAVVTFPVADPAFTEWNSAGGIGGSLGAATGIAAPISSVAKTAGTQQTFVNGAVFSYPAGTASPSTYAVSGSIYNAFALAGGYSSLGFPTTEEVTLTSGLHRQVFEGGRIEWTPGSSPTVLFPIGEIDIANASAGLNLNVGATATLSALVYDTHGSAATGRTLAWSTSNGSVALATGNGATAVVLGIGSGVASIYVTGEGKTSAPFSVRVNSSCCGIGQGAPTTTITQAFQIAAARNHLAVTLPNATSVTQSGPGYVQTVTAADSGGNATAWVIAESGKSAIAYVIGGSLYAAYLANGGFAGPLGYPSSDASPGGTQFFEGGAALAGSPVQLVPVPIAARWLQSGADAGLLGTPVSSALAFVALNGITGNSQTFANGAIYGITSGSRAGRAFIASGPILARYLALSGPSGSLGIPVADAFFNGAVEQQNFQTGYIDIQPGAAAAVEHFNPRNPVIGTTPAAAGPGGRVHIGISGFVLGARLAVSITSQPSFTVTVPSGEYGWDIAIPANATPGTITIQAKATDTADVAVGSYTIASLPQLQPTLNTVSGDRQTGLPGSTLTAPLIAILVDVNGNPLPGVPVSYTVSPGASAQVPAITGASGQIAASFRLPPAAGVAALTISAGGRVVSFSALSAAGSIPFFPSYTQVDVHGGLTAALAAVIRYYQNQGTAGSPRGPATPAGLTQFLTETGGYSTSETGGAIANPWIATLFAGVGGVSIETPTLDRVRDLLNGGSPVVLALSVQQDGTAAGGVAIDAIGVNADGSIVIADPNPVYGRFSLSDYLSGFTSQGHTIQGALSAAIRILPVSTTPNGFVSASQISALAAVSSPAGPCPSVDLLDQAGAGGIRFIGCDGTQAAYQLEFENQKGAGIVDLTGGTVSYQQITVNSGVAFGITRVAGRLAISTQTIAITSVVNSASLAPGLSPGGLFTIFGRGLNAGSSKPVVTVAGQTASVLAAFPFQINAQLPQAAIPGSAELQISAALGTAGSSIDISTNSPGIFIIGGSQGAILNQDGTINTEVNPAQRGQYISIYCTGLGATTAQGSVETATLLVEVVLNGISVKPAFSGLTPGITGLYQVNVQIPAELAPGISTVVALEQLGQSSNTAVLAVE